MNKENCIHLSYACGEEFCLIGKGNKNIFGYYHSYKESLCKGCQSFLSNETMKNLYFKVKNEIIEKGHLEEIEWYNNIPNLKELDKTFFFREYVWVVINSGMKNIHFYFIFGDTFVLSNSSQVFNSKFHNKFYLLLRS